MDNAMMRFYIRGVYKTASWQRKVDNMGSAQVTAVYLSFVRRGLL